MTETNSDLIKKAIHSVKNHGESDWITSPLLRKYFKIVIEQAERVDESEVQLERKTLRCSNLTECLWEKDDEIKRLREALEHIKKITNYDALSKCKNTCHAIARQALEGAK